MNPIRFAWNLAWAKLLDKAVPFQVTINLTDTCNLRCEYCYCAYPERRKPSIPHPRLMDLIDELAAAGTIKVNLAGGEPLAYKEVDAVIDKIVDRGMDCFLNTNGYFVNRHLDAIRRVTRLNVSIDGDRGSHDEARGEGSFDKAIAALELAQQEGIPRLLTAVIGAHNADQLNFLEELSRRYDAWVVVINLMQPRDLPKSRFAMGDAQARELFTEILERKQRGQRFVYSEDSIRILLDWPLDIEKDVVSQEEFPAQAIPCYAGRFFCAVDTNGELFPCCPSIGIVGPAPSICDQPFMDAFAELRNHSCYACNVPVSVDMNLLFGLKPSVVLNTLKAYQSASPKGGTKLPPTIEV
jgi:MoaA/NifB/PqqE/SkfB family radical SAM enzyme